MKARRAAAAAMVLAASVSGALVLGRHQPRPIAHALYLWDSEDGRETEELMLMATSHEECAKALRRNLEFIQSSTSATEIAQHGVKFRLECIPESDPRVEPAWRTQQRRVGQHQGASVYFYGPDREADITGAYVFMTPAKGDVFRLPAKDDQGIEVDSVATDQTECQKWLDDALTTWREDRKYSNEAEFKKPEYKKMFDDDERRAAGACIPVKDPARLRQTYCEGVPFVLHLMVGRAAYDCDYDILKPIASRDPRLKEK